MIPWESILLVLSGIIGIGAIFIKKYHDPETMKKFKAEKSKESWDKEEKKIRENQSKRLSD